MKKNVAGKIEKGTKAGEGDLVVANQQLYSSFSYIRRTTKTP